MRLFRAQGFSLIEVLVAAGVIGVMATIMGGSIIALGRQNAMLVDQLAAADLARSVTEVLKSSRCSLMLAGSNVSSGSTLTFDPASVSITHPHKVALAAIPLGASQNLVDLNQSNVSSLSPRLRLASNGIVLKVTGADTGMLVLQFDPANLIKPIANLEFPLALATTGSGASTTVVACGGASELLPVGSVIACSWVYINNLAQVPDPPCQQIDASTKVTEVCSPGWATQNCHGTSDDDCCVKVQANAFP